MAREKANDERSAHEYIAFFLQRLRETKNGTVSVIKQDNQVIQINVVERIDRNHNEWRYKANG